MSGECTVTPGKTWSNETVTDAKLNLTANPVVRVDEDSITSRELSLSAVAAALLPYLPVQLVQRNYFRNPGFSLPQGGHTHTSGRRLASPAAGWWWQHTGTAAVTTALSTNSIQTNTVDTRLFFTGASGTSTDGLLIGQSFGPDLASDLHQRVVTLSWYIGNGSGATFEPVAQVRTWTGADPSGGTTTELSTTLAALTVAGSPARRQVTFDLQSLNGGDALNGFDVCLYLPVVLDSDAKSVSVTAAQLEISQAGGSYTGTQYDPGVWMRSTEYPHRIHYSASAPAVGDDTTKGWMTGDIWQHGVTARYVCISSAFGAADWNAL